MLGPVLTETPPRRYDAERNSSTGRPDFFLKASSAAALVSFAFCLSCAGSEAVSIAGSENVRGLGAGERSRFDVELAVPSGGRAWGYPTATSFALSGTKISSARSM